MTYLRVISALAVLGVTISIGGSLPPVPAQTRAAGKPGWTPVSEQRLSHGRFENFTVYSPHATPKGFVLLLSGSEGWSRGMSDLATHLAQQGAMVAGLDVAQLDAALESDGGQCVFPDGDLENLSHFVQAYYRLPTYLSPILAGYAAGGTLAYATLVQAPQNTFAGAVSLEFCPGYGLSKPLCKGSGIEFTRHSSGKGIDFLPTTRPGNAWTVLQEETRQGCDLASVRRFVAQVPGAQFIALSATEGGAAPAWTPQAATAFDALMARNAGVPQAVPSTLSDLPLVTVAAQGGGARSDTFAIILSGDGGWAGLDKDVAGALAASGIPVVGLDSLRYFWSARTPQGLAADIDRMIRYYTNQLGRERVMLVGYSQGADVLPFAVNRLSPATRSHVALTAVMGMSEHALFEFHVSNWIADDDSGPATLPEVERIGGMAVLCIYGEEESDSLCPKLDPHRVTVVKLKGGHHFDGNYAGLARTILASAHP